MTPRTLFTTIIKKSGTFALTWLGAFALQRKFSSSPTSTNFGLFVSALISFIIATLTMRRLFRNPVPQGHRRRLSLFSQLMVAGFGKRSHCPQSIINGWVYFDQIPSIPASIMHFGEQVANYYPKFKSRVEYSNEGFVWSQAPNFELKDRFFVHFVKNDQELHHLATSITATPFRHDSNSNINESAMNAGAQSTPAISTSSPWEIHHIVNLGKLEEDGVKSKYDVGDLDPSHIDPQLDTLDSRYNNLPATITDGKGSSSSHHIMLFRLDHTIGDGVALLNVFGKLVSDKDGQRPNLFTAPKYTASTDQVQQKQQQWGCSGIFKYLRTGFDLAKHAVAIASLPNGAFDTPSSYNQCSNQQITYHHPRAVVIVPTVCLDNLKQIKNGVTSHFSSNLVCTINDVLMSATSGAFRRLAMYNERIGINSNTLTKQTHPIFLTKQTHQEPPNVLCRALLPVAFPRPAAMLEDKEEALSNQFTFLSSNLHISSPTLDDRFAKIIRDTAEIKKGIAPAVSFGLTKLTTAIAPSWVGADAARNLFSRHSVVFSNVPGPQGDIYYCGEKISGIQMVYPNIITQVGVLTLNNHMFMNFTCDPIEMPNAEKLGQFVHEELVEMFGVYVKGREWVKAFSAQ